MSYCMWWVEVKGLLLERYTLHVCGSQIHAVLDPPPQSFLPDTTVLAVSSSVHVAPILPDALTRSFPHHRNRQVGKFHLPPAGV